MRTSTIGGRVRWEKGDRRMRGNWRFTYTNGYIYDLGVQRNGARDEHGGNSGHSFRRVPK